MTEEIINFNKLVTDIINKDNDDAKWGEGDTDETYHPSSLGNCMRQMFLTKAGIKKPDRTLKGIFFIGRKIHEIIQEGLEDKGEIEKKITLKVPDTNLIIKGSIDFLSKDNIVYDFKTVSNIKKWMYGKEVDMFKEIKPEHRIQACVYMESVGSKTASIVYIDKKFFTTRQLLFYYDKAIIDAVYQKIKTFHLVFMEWKAKGGDITQIPFPKCSCAYCKYE